MTNRNESAQNVDSKIHGTQITVAIVVLLSVLVERMSDDSDLSFRERVDEIRDEMNEETQTEREEGAADQRMSSQEEMPQQTRWAIVAGAFLVGGILGAMANPTQAASAFIGMGFLFGGVAWLFVTESGKKFRKEFAENMNDMQQQQQASSSSKPKVVCSECGWQNPKTNNYCHDCGSELGS